MKKLLLVSLCFLMLGITQVFAQNRTVTGTVTARDDGQSVPGVSVRVKGTTNGVQTSANGSFSIPNVAPGAVLVFSFVGYNTQEVPVGAKGSLNVVLAPNSKQLTEVVVTSFGTARQSSSLGYGTAKITGKDITTAKPISIVNGLTGKVSGLQVSTTNNGLFAPSRVTLRGNRSLTGNNQPLIVVDGSIFYSDISTLNPEDIESTTILKGSSSAAVYGSDASNGVIVITTKHGSRAPSVTFSSTTSLESVAYLPAMQTRFGANGGEKLVDDFTDLTYYIPYENQSYGPEYNGKLVPLGRPISDTEGPLLVPYAAIKNQKKDFYDLGVTTQNNFSYSQGDAAGSFFMSFQDVKSKAVTPGDNGRRDVFRLSGDKKYGIFSTSYALTYTRIQKNQTNTGAVYNNLIESPLNVPYTQYYSDITSKYGNPNGYYNDYYLSPYQEIAQERYLSLENHINGNVQFNLKPAKWVNLSYRAAIDNNAVRSEYKNAGITFSSYAQSADTIYYSNRDATGFVKLQDAGTKASAINQLPQYGISNFSNFLFNSDFLANFNTKFAKDFTVDGTLGVSFQANKITAQNINATPLNFLPYSASQFASTPTLGTNSYDARKIGYFGDARVGYKGYAYVHGSYRTDLDSRLSKENRYIGYYDVDGSVVLSELFKGITNNDYLNFAKIRYAHSVTGNISALSGGSQYIAYGAYQTLPTLVSSSGFPYASTGIGGYSLNTVIANPNIKPEKVTEDEFGLDLGFLKDRINFAASVYRSRTTDGIVYAQVSRASGFTTALINAANSTNKGFELDLSGSVIRTQDLTWTVKANWSHMISNVSSIVSGVNSLNVGNSSYAVVGLPYAQLQGFDWNRDPATGKVIVDANTGLPTKGTTLKPLGQVNPKDILGLSTTVNYKNFSFSATADYRAGHKIFNLLGRALDHSGVGEVTAISGRQRFVFPNSVYKDANGNYVDNTNVEVQDANYNFWPTLYQSIDANYVTSAAAWKLREVAVTYNVPNSWLLRTKVVKAASLTLSGRNLLMYRPSTNKFTDPEFSEDTGNGVGRTSVNQNPASRIYSATLTVTL